MQIINQDEFPKEKFFVHPDIYMPHLPDLFCNKFFQRRGNKFSPELFLSDIQS